MMDDTIEELFKYVELGMDEVSEYCVILRDLYEKKDMLSSSLKKELEIELKNQLSDYKKYFKIVTYKDTVKREWQELEYVE
ncbi:hypothetical protein [Pseudoalteromonas sp.]|uniref:hypothetical protein n=1 Tax=Pseudoalteromonas sp. TaxID=53249 RepID=UPI0026108EAD|nr:hypothetical protein [Pseudoalteromonas sp.]MCP4585340.1 hypothetical protein [Pseudoalteromonas sp.]